MSLIGVLMLAEGQSNASDASDSDALITRGLALRQKDQDRQALPLFQEAATKNKTPRAIAQVGLCELALGLWVDADAHLQQALANKTDAWIHKNERSLKTALDGLQEKLGFVDVWGEPVGAKVAIDGRAAGTLPMDHPLRLPSGRHSLLIEAPGFLIDTRFVEVAPRTVAREHVALAPVPVLTQPTPRPLEALPPPPSTQPAGTVVTNTEAVSDGSPKADSASPDPIYKRWWFWTAIGVAAVAAGGAVFILTRKDQCQSSEGGACVAW